MEALYRLLALTLANIRKMNTFCEETVQAFFDAIIAAALECVNMSKSKVETVKIIPQPISTRLFLYIRKSAIRY